jgi:hypothetical protein
MGRNFDAHPGFQPKTTPFSNNICQRAELLFFYRFLIANGF